MLKIKRMDFKTENFSFCLSYLLGKGKANYLSRKVILQKIFRVFQSCNFMRKNFQDKAGNFYCVPANFGATDKPCGEGVRMLTQNCC